MVDLSQSGILIFVGFQDFLLTAARRPPVRVMTEGHTSPDTLNPAQPDGVHVHPKAPPETPASCDGTVATESNVQMWCSEMQNLR